MLIRPPKIAVLISIHALRGEGDFFIVPFPCLIIISIHALRGEGDGGKLSFKV